MKTYSPRYTSLDQAVSDEVKARLAVTRGVTVKGVAEALDVRRATLSARVNGHAPFSLDLLSKVATLLGTTATDITAAAERRRRSSTGEGPTSPSATGDGQGAS